jgi:hypothetical protein
LKSRELWSTRRVSTKKRVTIRNKSKGAVKNFNSGSLLFIGARGGSSAKGASIRPLWGCRVTRVPSDVPRVTFFTKFPKYSWNRIVGVNPLPRGASVGEFRKTRHPRNVESNEVREICFSGAKHWRFSGILNLQSLGVVNTQRSGTSNLRSHELRETGNSGIRRESCSEVMNKGIHEQVRSKVKVVVSKSSGLGCELVACL